MLVVQVTINKIIDVVAVRDRFVSTAWTVNMVGRVTGTDVTRGACVRVRVAYFKSMLFDNPSRILMMEMTIV